MARELVNPCRKQEATFDFTPHADKARRKWLYASHITYMLNGYKLHIELCSKITKKLSCIVEIKH